MYKYQCRGCRVQESCITESDTAPGAKVMIRNAFAARTDTMSTWATLQKNCLLVQEDEERERRAREGTLLGRRMRQARAKQDEPEETVEEQIEPATQVEDDSLNPAPSHRPAIIIGADSEPVTTDRLDTPSTDKTPDQNVIISAPKDIVGARTLGTAPLDDHPVPKDSGFFWLTIRASQRHISLPISGNLVLGRFDPTVTHPLDVDLTFEDLDAMTVSRRHARIVGVDGYHTIEDMNSSNGLFINGKQMPTHRAHRLEPGDQVVLGKLKMLYDKVPHEFLEILSMKMDQLHQFLFHTHNGRKMELFPHSDIIIGRFRPSDENSSKINLVEDGEVATYVSRQHARITWNGHNPLLQDLDSSRGTRLNGKRLRPRQTAPLNPGDHISLGGCVLAYDVEVKP